MNLIPTIATIVAMILFSALFSGMEIAFASRNRLKEEIDRRQSRIFNYTSNLFSRNAGQYITTILVGNNIALVVYSLSMSMLIHLIANKFGWVAIGSGGLPILETAISTIVIIFLAEFIPKSVFRTNPNFYYRTLSPLIFLFYIILYPIAKLTTLLSQLLLRIMGHRSTPNMISSFDRSDIASLFDSDGAAANDQENEMKIFQNALDFADLRVRDCMTHRVDIEAVDMDNTSIEDVRDRFTQTKYSRLFVWRESIDNIVGYINSKSLFTQSQTLPQLMRSVNFVPESMPLSALLQSLTKHKTNLAVVIDEFGGTAGVITLEDVLEQIFGEIEDEHDEQELTEKQISDNEWVLSCRLEVKLLNEKYNLSLEESDEYDTLAGYIIYHHNGIPSAGDTLLFGRYSFKILSTSRSRLELARIKLRSEKIK